MPVLGNLIHRGLRLRARLARRRRPPIHYQRTELQTLLSRAEDTAFGHTYDFPALQRAKDPVAAFQERVPIFDYDTIHEAWWHRALDEEADVAWPGAVPYFALSSGTSGAPSKYIPVTTDMVRAVQRAGIKQIYSLAAFHLPDATFQKSVLILGGSTELQKRGPYLVGDMSGISADQIPSWFHHFYKPGPDISAQEDWTKKLDAITEQASEWDVGIVCGVPAWVRLLFQKIIDHYGVDSVHEVWPNLSVYVHGGVAFGPYRKPLNELVERPLVTIDTYIASEGYIAFQPAPNSDMRMLLNNGIFYEFVPFTDDNFDADGHIVDEPQTLTIDEVEEGTPYALLLSTCAGAWRYLLGDVIQFADVDTAAITIAGRTQHFLNLAGEHLSVGNMVQAVEALEAAFDVPVPEFTVIGETDGSTLVHHWFVGLDAGAPPVEGLSSHLDATLRRVNDDYRIKRNAVLDPPSVTPLPLSTFYDWMETQGNLGGQNKFPRGPSRPVEGVSCTPGR